jgi:hypothetical protein
MDHPTAGWPQQSEEYTRGNRIEEGWWELNEMQRELRNDLEAKKADHLTAGWPQQSEEYTRGNRIKEGW